MIKKHYIRRGGSLWWFRSLAEAREFLATARTPNGYRSDLEPRMLRRPLRVDATIPY